MANQTPDVGTGARFVWNTSAWVPNKTVIRHNGISRAVIQTSHLLSTAHTFIPGDLINPGQVEYDMEWDPENPPPYTATAETCKIMYPMNGVFTTTATTGTDHVTFESFSAFWVSISKVIPLEDKITATVTVQLTGAITKVNAGV